MSATSTRLSLSLALALAATGAQAKGGSCEIESDYDLSWRSDRLEFAAERDGTPLVTLYGGGRLVVDGEAMRLSAADRERLRLIEHEMRRLVPEVQAIALEAVDIAFTALHEVAHTLAGDGSAVADLRQARIEVERDLRASPAAAFDERVVDHMVGDLVAELVPTLVGEVVKAALSAAFTGDTARAEALEARANRLERDIEWRIEPRAKALEARADKLCEHVVRIDRIENALEYRLPDGTRLDLLRSGPD